MGARAAQLVANVVLVGSVAVACGGAATPTATGSPGSEPAPASEPSGTLLWVHDGTETWPPELWAVPIDGGEPAPVDLVPSRAIDRAWSPDLTRLAWLEEVRSGVPGARVVIGDPVGSSPVVVGELRHWNDYRGHAWSDDGSRFAYAAYTDAGTSLRVVDAATGTSREIRTWDLPAAVDVDWAPDGSRLVVAVGDGPAAGVSTIAADGSDERRLSELGAWRVRWSPTGSTIAFEATDGVGPLGIHVVGPDGAGERRLSPPGVVEMGPVWSPDGGWLAFASERDAAPFDPDELRDQPLVDEGIYVMRADGTDVRRLVAPVERGWAETLDWFASWPPAAA